jgi:hypothetical protein
MMMVHREWGNLPAVQARGVRFAPTQCVPSPPLLCGVRGLHGIQLECGCRARENRTFGPYLAAIDRILICARVRATREPLTAAAAGVVAGDATPYCQVTFAFGLVRQPHFHAWLSGHCIGAAGAGGEALHGAALQVGLLGWLRVWVRLAPGCAFWRLASLALCVLETCLPGCVCVLDTRLEDQDPILSQKPL